MTEKSLYDASERRELEQIFLDMAHERALPALLSVLVERLRGLPEVALARIWLIRPGDICSVWLRGQNARTKRAACIS